MRVEGVGAVRVGELRQARGLQPRSSEAKAQGGAADLLCCLSCKRPGPWLGSVVGIFRHEGAVNINLCGQN